MMTYELWEDIDGSISMFPETNSSARALLKDSAVLVKTFQANTWEEACQMENDFLEWGEYRAWQEPCALAS